MPRSAPKPEPIKLAKTAKAMAELADAWWDAREERLRVQHEAEKIEVKEKALKKALLVSLIASDIKGAVGRTIKVERVTKDKPVATDWLSIWKWAKKNDAMDIYQRRLSETAVKERWEAGKTIPGVEAFPVDDISYSQIK